jgi:hypothetical protein
MRRMAAEPAVWGLRVGGMEVEVMDGSCADGEWLEAMEGDFSPGREGFRRSVFH